MPKAPAASRPTGGFVFPLSLGLVGMLLLVLCLLPGMAQANKLTTGADFLRMGQGAHGPAMADAVTARPEGMLAVQYNPAGLAYAENSQVEASYQSMVLDINQGMVGGLTDFAHGGIGFDVNFINYGSEDRFVMNDGPQQDGSFSGSDLAVGLSYGQTILEAANHQWAVGVTTRVIRVSIDDQTSSALAADFGLHGKMMEDRLQLGLALRNFGSDLKFDSEREELPELIRAGVAFRLHEADPGDPFPFQVWLQGEIEDHHDGETPFYSGLELGFDDRFFFRAGYDDRTDIGDRYRLGVGLIMDEAYLDYAFVPSGEFGDNHRVAIGFFF